MKVDSKASNHVNESTMIHDSEMDGSGHHHPELTPAFEADDPIFGPIKETEGVVFCWGGKKHKCTKVWSET